MDNTDTIPEDDEDPPGPDEGVPKVLKIVILNIMKNLKY